ncbi:DJ-1/PfpI family protein [Nostoc sp. CHAB 5784]|uniref:DJ-1/PfpI family protein n=1 Tax=Nostoc mirabile TaxID=2907820 RepID=UPI001E628742|nr:DJ-1/PfpI family protein [Nostoc mirabile]MCC5668858.1 DJ-1/PfpI family protein [Nostoc mirabile CHAB5784]
MTITSKGKIGVLIAEYFGEVEYQQFNYFFPKHGYKVEYISNLLDQDKLTFKGQEYISEATVTIDFKDIEPTDYNGIILIGGYAMDRLRYQVTPAPGQPNQSPAIKFLRKVVIAMDANKLKVGTICHSLWLFCAAPELLKGRKVTCIHNIIDDVENAGGIVMYENGQTQPVYVDGSLISARHPGVIDEFITVFLKELEKKDNLMTTAISRHTLSIPS